MNDEKKPGPKTTIKDVQAQVNDLADKLDRVVDSTNESIKGLQGDFSASVEQILKAINNPVSLNKTPEPDIPNPSMVMEDNGEELVVVGGKSLDDPELRKKVETEAFYQEPVTIQLNPTSERHADPYANPSVNGNGIVIRRGEVKTIPRCYVEVLARATVAQYQNEEYQKNNGEHAVRWPVTMGWRYPISIVKDTPEGLEWYQNLLREEASRIH